MFRLKSQALGSEQLKCRQWESNRFTVCDYSPSISPATTAAVMAVERLVLQLQIDFCDSCVFGTFHSE